MRILLNDLQCHSLWLSSIKFVALICLSLELIWLNMMWDKLRNYPSIFVRYWKLTTTQKFLIHSSLCRLLSRNGSFFSIQIHGLSTKFDLKRSISSKKIALVRIPSSPCRNYISSHGCLEVLDILIFPSNDQYVLREEKKARRKE